METVELDSSSGELQASNGSPGARRGQAFVSPEQHSLCGRDSSNLGQTPSDPRPLNQRPEMIL